MTPLITRRAALTGGLALGACARSAPAAPAPAPALEDRRFAAIETRIGGRVGVAAWNVASDTWLGYRSGERFALCSTFKWALAAAQLNLSQRGGPSLAAQLQFDEADMLDYAPVARQHLARGWMTVEEACEAATVLSDNAAANLLLESQGGPAGFTRFLREHGDSTTRLDRIEPALNDVAIGEERDTVTPEAMTRTLRRFLLDDGVLSAEHREKLIGWMVQSPTGRERLRAGFPADWRVADKTGTWTGDNNATNDVAIAWPTNGAGPIVVSVYLHRSTADAIARNNAHAEIARIIAEEWG